MSSGSPNSLVTVSIVSHGHGAMVWPLVEQLQKLPSVTKIIVTLNIPESLPGQIPVCVELIHNRIPLGFGANHNQAVTRCYSDFFCVLNPDIELIGDPFPALLSVLETPNAGIVGPQVINSQGGEEDSLREFPSPVRMLRRYLVPKRQPRFQKRATLTYPEWIAGMFMLFRVEDYRRLGGFDQDYFMYCEDADICTRTWMLGKQVAVETSVSVVHNAQRASRRSLRHLVWHVTSLLRYWFKHLGRSPRVFAN